MHQLIAKITGRKVFFRATGQGKPMVLLHASPSSSNMMVPLMKELSTNFTVIAPDTPGYGRSEKLPDRPTDLSPYTALLKAFFERLGFSKISLYGTATGAQLAIRYALENPDHVEHLYLDNAAHFTDSQRSEILKHYFPDIRPRYDGSHLLTLWTMVRDLFVFFPWCNHEPSCRLNVPFPPARVLHQVALDYLTAGPDYDLAYRAAFEHEKAEYVQQLRVPTTIFAWQSSIVKPYIDQLLDHDLPDNVSTVTIPAGHAQRLSTMSRYMTQKRPNGNPGKEVDLLTVFKEAKAENSWKSDLPPLVPDVDGAYLIRAWFHLRDRQLFEDPAGKVIGNKLNQRPNIHAEELQKALTQWMKVQ